MIEVKFEDSQIKQTLAKLEKKGKNARPVMADIGKHLVESTQQRFARSESPDGEKWAANSDSVIKGVLSKTKGNYKKRGGLSAKGKRRSAAKRPLIGESKQLKNVHYKARSNGLEVGSSRIYAAVQQFGAKQGDFGNTKRGAPIPFGDIPARPYLGFSDDDKSVIMEILKEFLKS